MKSLVTGRRGYVTRRVRLPGLPTEHNPPGLKGNSTSGMRHV